MTIALDDLGAHERRLREDGLPFTEEVSGNAPRRLVVRETDGNTFTFFEDPAQDE